MWKPNTVEEIRDWFSGRYVLNPTDAEYWQQLKARLRAKTVANETKKEYNGETDE